MTCVCVYARTKPISPMCAWQESTTGSTAAVHPSPTHPPPSLPLHSTNLHTPRTQTVAPLSHQNDFVSHPRKCNCLQTYQTTQHLTPPNNTQPHHPQKRRKPPTTQSKPPAHGRAGSPGVPLGVSVLPRPPPPPLLCVGSGGQRGTAAFSISISTPAESREMTRLSWNVIRFLMLAATHLWFLIGFRGATRLAL